MKNTLFPTSTVEMVLFSSRVIFEVLFSIIRDSLKTGKCVIFSHSSISIYLWIRLLFHCFANCNLIFFLIFNHRSFLMTLRMIANNANYPFRRWLHLVLLLKKTYQGSDCFVVTGLLFYKHRYMLFILTHCWNFSRIISLSSKFIILNDFLFSSESNCFILFF